MERLGTFSQSAYAMGSKYSSGIRSAVFFAHLHPSVIPSADLLDGTVAPAAMDATISINKAMESLNALAAIAWLWPGFACYTTTPLF
jgi:hypothetical protein